MRREFWIAILLLSLSGCYAPSADPGYGYAQPGYPPGGYPPPGYPASGYAPSPYDGGGEVYPGYSYNGGSPTYFDSGVSVPLVFFGGEWGFYDRERHWHHAPDRVSRDLEAHRAGGGQFGHDGAPRGEPNGQPRPGQPGGAAGFRPAEPPRGAPPQAVFRPGEQPRLAPPQAAFRPGEQPRVAPPPQAAFRPAEQPRGAAPQPQREEHGRGRDCPPGQHC